MKFGDSQTWIDAHCHLSDPRLEATLSTVMTESEKVGVGRWILAGYSPEDWRAQIALDEKFPGKLALSFGLHPWWVCEKTPEEIEQGLQLLSQQLSTRKSLQLVGELGLDFFGPRAASQLAEKQYQAFAKQMDLAVRFKKKVVLHIVRAHEQALTILKQFPQTGGWVHSFSGSAEQADQYVRLGFAISMSGSATRMPENKVKRILETVPPDCLLVETDSPDQMPKLEGEPAVEGTLNVPANLLKIAEGLAKISGKSAHSLLDQSRDNLIRILTAPVSA